MLWHARSLYIGEEIGLDSRGIKEGIHYRSVWDINIYKRLKKRKLRLTDKKKDRNNNTFLQSWCCGFPSIFVPGFLQMEGSVRLQGLSFQRPSCACQQHTDKQRERTQLFNPNKQSRSRREGLLLWDEEGHRQVSEVTHRSPDGDTVLLSVAEVIGLKGVP